MASKSPQAAGFTKVSGDEPEPTSIYRSKSGTQRAKTARQKKWQVALLATFALDLAVHAGLYEATSAFDARWVFGNALAYTTDTMDLFVLAAVRVGGCCVLVPLALTVGMSSSGLITQGLVGVPEDRPLRTPSGIPWIFSR